MGTDAGGHDRPDGQIEEDRLALLPERHDIEGEAQEADGDHVRAEHGRMDGRRGQRERERQPGERIAPEPDQCDALGIGLIRGQLPRRVDATDGGQHDRHGIEGRRELEHMDPDADQAGQSRESQQAQHEGGELSMLLAAGSPLPGSHGPDRTQEHDGRRLERGELPAPGHRRPCAVAALPALISRSATVKNRASARGTSIPLTIRTNATSASPSMAGDDQLHRGGSISSFSSPASMKWIGTTIRVVTSIIWPARAAPHRTRIVPEAGEHHRPDQCHRALAHRRPEQRPEQADAPRRSS